MAIDASAMNLLDLKLNSNEPRVTKIADSMLNAGGAFDYIPIVKDETLVQHILRQRELPAGDWLPLNVEPTVTKSAPTSAQERLFVNRRSVQADHLILRDKHQRTNWLNRQVDLLIRSFTYEMMDVLINGNPATDPDAPVGLDYRTRVDPTTYQIQSSNVIDAGGATADYTVASMTAKTQAILHEKFDEALYEIDDPTGNNTIIIANDAFVRRTWFGYRQFSGSGGFSQDKDAIGRTVMMYRGAKLVYAGRKRPAAGGAQTTQVITNTETAAGAPGSSTFTSVYFVKYGTDAFHGWSFDSPPVTVHKGTRDGQIIREALVEATLGFKAEGTRDIARVYDIKMS